MTAIRFPVFCVEVITWAPDLSSGRAIIESRFPVMRNEGRSASWRVAFDHSDVAKLRASSAENGNGISSRIPAREMRH
jgi:hypothetical protein